MRTSLRALLLAAGLVLTGPPLRGAQEPGGAQEEQDPVRTVLSDEVVRRIVVVGNDRYEDSQLVAALGVRVGEPLDGDVVDQGIRLLFDTFRVRAEVQKRPLPLGEGGGIEVRLVVEELASDLEPRFVGNVRVDDDEILEWAGLREREELFLYQAPRIEARLEQRYREEGYYFVEVNVVERPAGTDPETGLPVAPDVIFEIKEGPKVRVRDVEVHGNESLPDSRFLLFFRRGLKKLAEVELGPPGIFGLFADAFDPEALEADVLAMREVYRDLGYLDAIVQVDRLEFSEDKRWVTIHVAVDEGGRYTIGSLGIEAVEPFVDANGSVDYRPAELRFPEEELLAMLELSPGEIYERRLHQEDERTLRQHYGEAGYIDHYSLKDEDRWHFLEPRLTFEADAPVVHVSYRVAQGRRIWIREIPIVGNVHTQDRVVRRQLTVKPGDVANPTEIERSRQRIRSTGYFSDQFDINHREPEYRYLDTEDPSWKDLQFLVEEGNVLTFNLSGGISSNSGAFGTVSLAMENFDATRLPTSFWTTIEDIASRQAFHGAGQRLSLNASPGTERSFYDVTFSEPDLFLDHEDRISLSVFARRSIRFYLSHDEERNEVGFRLGRSLDFDSAVFTGYRIGSVDVSDLSGGGEPGLSTPLSVPEDLKAQEGETDLASLLLGYRYSSIDDRINPRNGFQFDVENEVFLEGVGSDEEFVKSDLRIDWWKEMDDDPDLVSPYVHLQLGAGVAVPFGDSDEVPYTERFFLGGLSTLRGFRFRGVGPNENDFPIGGQTMLHGTVEYRRPLVKQIQPGTYREYESIQGGVFFDWGVLDPEEFSIDVSEIRTTVGVLFGLSVPLPITFSFAWPVGDEEPGDRERVFAFNIGLR